MGILSATRVSLNSYHLGAQLRTQSRDSKAKRPIEGECLVLALVERERKLSFGEVRCALQVDGVRIYAL
jgi:hypothetical protein